MSRYTTELRYPVEQRLMYLHADLTEGSWPLIYDFVGIDDYPIFDEAYRQTLNDKILRAYWFREIGFETWGQFRWNMRRTMFEIMDYYNQMYKSTKLVTEPLHTRDMWFDATTHGDASSTTASGSESSTQDKGRNVFQDTPMNGLDTGAIESMDYATNVTFDTSDGSTTSNSRSEGTNEREETRATHERGFDGNQSELLEAYRRTFVNIDLDIVRELDRLFMRLW